MQSEILIKLHNVHKIYDMGGSEVRALNGISLEIKRGEFVAIMGASGSGKSTLMNLIGCLDRPTSGDYFLAGDNVAHLGDNDLAHIRNERIGFVFQSFNLLPRTSAVENVELPLVYAGAKNRRKLAADALKSVGLGERISHKPSELSGGEQQRVAVARAIINNPDLLLADEPTGNLDSKVSIEIMKLFWELHLSGKTIVIVTHEDDIAAFAGRVIRMLDGNIVSDTIQTPKLAKGNGEIHSEKIILPVEQKPLIETKEIPAPTVIEKTADDISDDEFGLVERVSGIINSPAMTFRRIADSPDFLTPFLLLSLISIIIAILVIPKTLPITESTAITGMQEQWDKVGMPDDEQTKILSIVKRVFPIFVYAGAVIGSPIRLAFGWFMTSFLVYLTGAVMKQNVNLKSLMGVVPWISFITILSMIANLPFILRTEFVTMEQVSDYRLLKPFSLLGLIPSGIELPVYLQSVFSTLDPFYIWGVFLLIFAISGVTRCSVKQASIISISVSIILLIANATLAAITSTLQAVSK